MQHKAAHLTERLVSCVMENMADEAIEILLSGNFDRIVLKDIGCCINAMPLPVLTRCWHILLKDASSWNGDLRHAVMQQKEGCKKLMDFWLSEYGYPVYEEIDFSPYEDECAHFNKYWDIEDLLGADIYTLNTYGYTRDECEFCYAVLTYRCSLIQKHLQSGTSADIDISDHPKGYAAEGETYNALKACSTFYGDALGIYGLSEYLRSGYERKIVEAEPRDIRLLLQAAAYCQLEALLKSPPISQGDALTCRPEKSLYGST